MSILKCGCCGKSFVSKNCIEADVRATRMGIVIKKYNHLKEHTSKSHTTNNHNVCQQCKNVFASIETPFEGS